MHSVKDKLKRCLLAVFHWRLLTYPLGICSTLTMWPIFVVLYFTKAEPLEWDHVPWPLLCGASSFTLGKRQLIDLDRWKLSIQVPFCHRHTCIQYLLCFTTK